MKLFLFLLTLLPCLALAADPVKTNARLPQDELIFPQPETKGEVKVTAKFKAAQIFFCKSV